MRSRTSTTCSSPSASGSRDPAPGARGGPMITRPTTDVLVLDCCRELSEEILPAIEDETLKLRLIMTVTVLGNAAVRAANEIAWMRAETEDLVGFARRVAAQHPDEA